MVLNDRDTSHDKMKFLLSIYDRGTRWLEVFPAASKDAAATKMSLQDFAGSVAPQLIYTDNSNELYSAIRLLGWKHDHSTDNRPQTNGVIERQNRNVLEGLRSSLWESGLEHK